MAEADAVVGEHAAPVRAAVGEVVEPALDRLALRRPVEVDDAAEPAHQRRRLARERVSAATARVTRRCACGIADVTVDEKWRTRGRRACG